MPRSYTRVGDQGNTGRFGPERRKKSDRLYAATGAIDEIAASIALAHSFIHEKKARYALERIEQFLFCAGADVATPHDKPCRRRITPKDTKTIESIIDEFEQDLDDLHNFVLPLGPPEVAALHVARAIVRRGERELVALADAEEINMALLPFFNRLSSLLFVMARWLLKKTGGTEQHPTYDP